MTIFSAADALRMVWLKTGFFANRGDLVADARHFWAVLFESYGSKKVRLGEKSFATLTSPMSFEWDERKNEVNISKHGFDFADAYRTLTRKEAL